MLNVREKLEIALNDVREYSATPGVRAVIELLAQSIESDKNLLVDTHEENVPEVRGGIRRLRMILDDIKRESAKVQDK